MTSRLYNAETEISVFDGSMVLPVRIPTDQRALIERVYVLDVNWTCVEVSIAQLLDLRAKLNAAFLP